MAKLLIFLFVIFFAFLILGISFIARFVRFFTKPSNNRTTSQEQRSYTNQDRQNRQKTENHQKIFSKDEGEYVDYEEIKDY